MTIPNNYKNSSLIQHQLPSFIRDDENYETFIAFLKAYYQWLETSNNVEDRKKNLLNYKDIDYTLDEFEKYFYNEFLPYFPEDCLADKRKLVKFSKEFYQRKGTEDSFKFLFRAIYNSEAQVYDTYPAVLIASGGKWIIPKSIKINSLDPRFLQIDNYRIVGEISKSFAKIERSQISGSKTEIFLTDIIREFTSGEFIRIIDNNNQDVIINGTNLRAKIVGSINSIVIDPNNKGLYYEIGDPVIITGGLNPDIDNPIGATAIVSNTSQGSIKTIILNKGSSGFRLPPNSVINLSGGGGSGANITITGVNNTSPSLIAFIPTDTILSKSNIALNASNYNFSNIAISNANTTLANALSFLSLNTYPISAISLSSGGSKYSSLPTISTDSYYPTDNGNGSIKSLGILGPISIVNGGSNYNIGESIIFTGGSGFGAYANISNVDSNGSIVSVSYVYNNNTTYQFPLGGLGYDNQNLPTLTINTANGNNAILRVSSILADGVDISMTTEAIGQILEISMVNFGEDYVSQPNVYLKIQDLVVSNVSLLDIVRQGELVYQTDANAPTFLGIVDSISKISDIVENYYSLRIYNYNGTLNSGIPLYVDRNGINSKSLSMNFIDTFSSSFFTNGLHLYGDGKAKANADFITGTVIGEGSYLNEDSHPSSHSKLQGEIYNNYTYILSVEQSFKKYKQMVLDILHPTGTKLIGRNLIKSKISNNLDKISSQTLTIPIQKLTHPDIYATITPNTYYSNTINFYNVHPELTGTYLSAVLLQNSYISLRTNKLQNVYSQIISVDDANSTILIKDDYILKYNNIAFGYANSISNSIHVANVTGKYDVITGGIYSDSNNKLLDMAFANDYISIGSNVDIPIANIDYTNWIIYTSNSIVNVGNISNTQLISIKRNYSTANILVEYNYSYNSILETNNVILIISNLIHQMTGSGLGNVGTTLNSADFDYNILATENNDIIFIPS